MLQVDARAFIASLRETESALLAAVRQILGQSAAYAKELAQRTTSFKDRTGKLRASIARGEKSVWSLFVRAGGPSIRYAAFVEDGTEPHVITARNGRALRFVVAGSVRFATSVHHPGTKPAHFMLNARDQAELKVMQFVESGLTRALQ